MSKKRKKLRSGVSLECGGLTPLWFRSSASITKRRQAAALQRDASSFNVRKHFDVDKSSTNTYECGPMPNIAALAWYSLIQFNASAREPGTLHARNRHGPGTCRLGW